MLSPATRLRSDNRSSDPRGFLPGNQIRPPEERPESLAYGSNMTNYQGDMRFREETVFE